MGDGGGPEPPADAGGQSPVCALLVPKTEVAVALRALNSLTPRWGAAVARLERERCKASQATRAGWRRERGRLHVLRRFRITCPELRPSWVFLQAG
ncbi:unnamed protein product [Prorocentrum cordatum]|uniref:Uncharacterized protein n=1 Tax=Prorocentrum cordatum TaxID=2364126 RepID=A0ABN9Y6M5_9DINO|nr:unnamed protein product [Polarella glacialis]